MPKQIRKPADPSAGAVAQFGYDLRVLRQRADMTYTELARRTYYSKSAIHAADQGHTLPSESLVDAYVTGCGGDSEDWNARRKAIAEQLAATRGPLLKTNPRAQGMDPPDPSKAVTVADYNDALKKLREWSGLTYKDIYTITQDYPRRLAPSTLCTATSRGTLPARDLVESLLRALGLDQAQQHTWLTVWQAFKDGNPVRPTHLLRRLTHPEHDPQRTGVAADNPPDAPDEQDVPPVMLYNPNIEIRDWILVNGRWRRPRRARLASITRPDARSTALTIALLLAILTILLLTR